VIGADTVIEPGTILRGSVHVGTSCQLGPHSEISNAVIGSETVVRQSTVTDSEVGNSVQIGPYAHIRPASSIGDEAKIGNFVEIKKASIGQGSKTSHLSYIGDAEVGKNVNIGCGSITVNYDGMDKHLTKIEDNVFIGCNSNLVAPVNVGKGAYVAAGSTITSDVPEDALSIARSRQTNKENYVSEKLNAGKKQNK
jgi:bifunctional UDP-N-acetylglucosamine pyrophosphorylase/glucosamine-1-phosphate N-acetyltransferase